MRKGDIVLIPFPFTDLSGQKVRPALVLHTSSGEDCIVAFISSKPQIRTRSFDIAISPTRKNGLKFDSVIKANKIATLQKKIVIGKLGNAETTAMKVIDQKLRAIFKL